MTDKSQKKEANGFTFIETIMYIAIIGLVIGAFVSFGLLISSIRNKNYAAQEVQANGRIILSFISDKVRAGGAVITPAAGAQSEILEIAMPGISGNSVFSLENGILYYTEGDAEAIPVSSPGINITSLQYNNLSEDNDKDSIRITISLEYRHKESNEYQFSQTLQTAVNIKL